MARRGGRRTLDSKGDAKPVGVAPWAAVGDTFWAGVQLKLEAKE